MENKQINNSAFDNQLAEIGNNKEVKSILNDIYSFLDEKIESDSFISYGFGEDKKLSLELGTSKKEILKKWFGNNKTDLNDSGLIDIHIKELLEGLSDFKLSKNEEQKSAILLLNDLKDVIKNSFKIEDYDHIVKNKDFMTTKLDSIFNLELDKYDDDYVDRKLNHLYSKGFGGIKSDIIDQKMMNYEKSKSKAKKRLKIEQEQEKLEKKRIKDKQLEKEIENKLIEERIIKEEVEESAKEKADEEMKQAIIDVDIDEEITDIKPYNSIVDFLKSEGVDSSFGNRRRLADEYGIYNYRGTKKQNIELLRMLNN